MPGTIVHMMAAKRAISLSPQDSILRKMTAPNLNIVLVGTVGPDLPYADPTSSFADTVHAGFATMMVRKSAEILQKSFNPYDQEWERTYAWLLGFASHVIMDAVVHPVVAQISGPYSDPENRRTHARCELCQDVFLCKEINNGLEVYRSEFSDDLRSANSAGQMKPVFHHWDELLRSTYPDPPQLGTAALYALLCAGFDTLEGGNVFNIVFRHSGIAVLEKLAYPPSDEFSRAEVRRYYEKVLLPNGGRGRYRESVFEKAVQEVSRTWDIIYDWIFNSGERGVRLDFPDWNLDTGFANNAPSDLPTFWSA